LITKIQQITVIFSIFNNEFNAMKRIINLTALLLVLVVNAQEFDAIVEAETKAALNRVNFVRNINTGRSNNLDTFRAL